MTSGSTQPSNTEDEKPNLNLPREEPLTIAGVSNLNKWKPNTTGPRKTVRPISRPPVRRLTEEKEEKSKKDRKDEPRVVEHFIMRNADVKNKVLLPVYNNLKKLKEKKKYSKEIAAKHLYYVVNYAVRKLNSGDTKISLSQIEKARVVNDLIRNFEKSVR